jgi:hypothetical protein
MAELGNDFSIEDFDEENLERTIRAVLSMGDALQHPPPVLLEMLIDGHVRDHELILEVLYFLKEKRKRLLLMSFSTLLQAVPDLVDNIAFRQIYREILSAPIDELISKGEDTRPFRAHHMSVVRDLLENLGDEPFEMDTWIIGGLELTWDEMIGRLCASGFSPLGAEIGGFVVDLETRNAVTYQLISLGHFDDALRFGFDKDVIFNFVIKEGLERATQTLIDEHFVLFVEWLKSGGYEDAIERVKTALMNQGRTVEVKRMMERLGRP